MVALAMVRGSDSEAGRRLCALRGPLSKAVTPSSSSVLVL